MNEVIEAPAQEVATPLAGPAANSPMGMMLAAMHQGATLEQVEKMMDLQERWEHREAEKAFNDALAGFKAEAVEVLKRKTVDFTSQKGRTYYKHAELSDVVEAVGPALSRHGFSWSWKTEQSAGQIRVTCILKHRQGHSDSVSLEASSDQSGNKNSIQAIASTVTYLQRHTLKAITGVSEKGDDNDGAGAEKDVDLRDEWISKIAQADNLAQAAEVWQQGCGAIQKTNNLAVYDAFKQAYVDKRAMLKQGEA
ncbi:ERF family protein [Bordetella bronchiseptica]|uniref:ERF family protein n=1 Tax=Bordetella bronchiseptica TaxID=518 RepID=UPI0009C0D99D|nr:ERF family protein [Bordetella bronchiseptica]